LPPLPVSLLAPAPSVSVKGRGLNVTAASEGAAAAAAPAGLADILGKHLHRLAALKLLMNRKKVLTG